MNPAGRVPKFRKILARIGCGVPTPRVVCRYTAGRKGSIMDSEIWFTTTAKGNRMAWKFSPLVGRAFRVAMAEAELALTTGAAVEIQKPPYVGGRR